MLLELIKKRYYSDIPEMNFWKVVKADPTSLDGKRIGRYSKWLFRIYRELPIVERFVEEDLPKATGYLKAFDKYKGRLPENQRDVNVYKSLSDLYLAVKMFIDRDKPITKMEVIREIKFGAEKVYEDEKWLVVIPHTREAACLYGAHTQWCTAGRENNDFEGYNTRGNLYINIDKQNNRKYQFHFGTQQFMDETNKEIEKNVLETIGATSELRNFYQEIVSRVDFMRFTYQHIGDFNEGLAKVKLDGRYGYIDKEGNVVIPIKYDDCYPFIGNVANVVLNSKEGMINRNGYEVIPIRYEQVCAFYNGLARVKLNDKYGFVDKSGQEVIPCKYDDAHFFKNGICAVRLNEKWGFIDKKGTNVVPFNYDDIYPFSGWPVLVALNGKWIFIDKSGAMVYK